MSQTWITVVALCAEAVGITLAAIGLRRSIPCFDRGTTEPWWASGGLALVGVGLLMQVFDLAIRPAIWP